MKHLLMLALVAVLPCVALFTSCEDESDKYETNVYYRLMMNVVVPDDEAATAAIEAAFTEAFEAATAEDVRDDEGVTAAMQATLDAMREAYPTATGHVTVIKYRRQDDTLLHTWLFRFTE